jgi:CBS domain-containing protein
MIREIVSIEPRKTTEEAVCLMVEHGISSLIVASDGILPWILMEKDVLTRVVARG